MQPIYSYCRNMDGLRRDVAARVRCFVREYVAERIDRDDLFRGTGRADQHVQMQLSGLLRADAQLIRKQSGCPGIGLRPVHEEREIMHPA